MVTNVSFSCINVYLIANFYFFYFFYGVILIFFRAFFVNFYKIIIFV